MSLQQLIAAVLQNSSGAKWHVTLSGAIRRQDGACPLEAAAGTGPHSLWSKAVGRLDLLEADVMRISAAVDQDWWPHRMSEWHIRRMFLDALGLKDGEVEAGRFQEQEAA